MVMALNAVFIVFLGRAVAKEDSGSHSVIE